MTPGTFSVMNCFKYLLQLSLSLFFKRFLYVVLTSFISSISSLLSFKWDITIFTIQCLLILHQYSQCHWSNFPLLLFVGFSLHFEPIFLIILYIICYSILSVCSQQFNQRKIDWSNKIFAISKTRFSLDIVCTLWSLPCFSWHKRLLFFMYLP